MPGPDVSSYIDLTVYDLDPSTLVSEAVANGQLTWPSWNPQEGNTELVLLEQQAIVAAELIYAVNRIPGAVAATMAQLFGVAPAAGAAATATVTFTFVDTAGYAVAAGASLSYTDSLGNNYLLTTSTDATAATGSQTATVGVTAADYTAALNGVPAGTVLNPVNLISGVSSVALATGLAGGQDPETSQQWLSRAVAKLSGLSFATVTADQFVTAAATFVDPVAGVPLAYRVMATDDSSSVPPTVTLSVLGQSPGHTGNPQLYTTPPTDTDTSYSATYDMLPTPGAPLTSTQMDAIASALTNTSIAGLDVVVAAAATEGIAVTATVHYSSSFDPNQVMDNVAAALANDPATFGTAGAGLSTDTWSDTTPGQPWSTTIRASAVIAAIAQAPGALYVDTSNTAPLAFTIAGNSGTDYAFPAGTLPYLSSLTLNMIAD